LNTFRTQARGDIFTPLRIDWRAKKIVMVKSAQHFYATYAPSAARVLYAETAGSMTMDWTKPQFRRRPPNIWLFRDAPGEPG
jgi:microcystin degradation protein MlrC